MWHTDWHVIKALKLKGKQFLAYLDDCSRRVMSYGVFDTPTTKNSVLVLYKAIAEHCVTPFELNSDCGSQFIPSKFDKNGKANICCDNDRFNFEIESILNVGAPA